MTLRRRRSVRRSVHCYAGKKDMPVLMERRDGRNGLKKNMDLLLTIYVKYNSISVERTTVRDEKENEVWQM